MTENIAVVCLVERFWDSAQKVFSGTQKNGTLISISVESDRINPEKIFPVGIVLFEDNTFESVPLEFITKQTQTN